MVIFLISIFTGNKKGAIGAWVCFIDGSEGMFLILIYR